MKLPPFQMERWQSLWEHRVEFNLSESGVEPLTFRELRQLTGVDPASVGLGYVQTNGSEELRRRIAALYPGATPENVVVTTGSAEANFLACLCLLGAGDRVSILEPTYGQTPGLVVGLGCRSSPFFLREERAWQPEPGAAAAAVGRDARLLVVTNPNNPTGAVLSPESLAEILEAAERAGAWILSDEVYAGAEVDGPTTPTLWGRYERVVVTGSLSKAYGLPGLRIGWAVAPADLAERIWAAKDYTTIAPTALSDRFAAAVLEPRVRTRILERTRGIIRENLDTLAAWIEARSPGFSWIPPSAGAIAFLRYGSGENSTALAERLRADRGVLVVPGDHFGMDGYLRIGFGHRSATFRAALERMADLWADRGVPAGP